MKISAEESHVKQATWTNTEVAPWQKRGHEAAHIHSFSYLFNSPLLSAFEVTATIPDNFNDTNVIVQVPILTEFKFYWVREMHDKTIEYSLFHGTINDLTEPLKTTRSRETGVREWAPWDREAGYLWGSLFELQPEWKIEWGKSQ